MPDKTSSTLPVPSIGAQFETVFSLNPKGASPFRYRSTRIGEQRAPKVILSNDSHIEPGKPCEVRVTKIDQPKSKSRGFIEVEFVSQRSFQLDDSFFIDPVVEKKLQALLELGRNILLDGPQGSGKTALSLHAANALGMEYVFFNCSAVYEPSDFIATIQVQAGPQGQAVTVWTPTPVLRGLEAALANPGQHYLIFLDEFNRCREIARNGLLPALDHIRKVYNPITGSFLPIPANVQWIAAVNNGAQFTGTTTVDPAQLDRFSPLQLTYPPAKEEIRLLTRRHPTVKPRAIVRVIEVANKIRSDEKLRLDLSVRATDEVCQYLSHPNFAAATDDIIRELMKSSFCGRFLGRWNDPSSDAGMVWEAIKSFP